MVNVDQIWETNARLSSQSFPMPVGLYDAWFGTILVKAGLFVILNIAIPLFLPLNQG